MSNIFCFPRTITRTETTIYGKLCYQGMERNWWGKKMDKLLLVDDDKELCSMLQNYLAHEGFDADAVHDGESAINVIGETDYHLIILDIMLPGLSGFDVLKALRKNSSVHSAWRRCRFYCWPGNWRR